MLPQLRLIALEAARDGDGDILGQTQLLQLVHQRLRQRVREAAIRAALRRALTSAATSYLAELLRIKCSAAIIALTSLRRASERVPSKRARSCSYPDSKRRRWLDVSRPSFS